MVGMRISKMFSVDEVFILVFVVIIIIINYLPYVSRVLQSISSNCSLFFCCLTAFPFILLHSVGFTPRQGSGPPGTKITILVKACMLKQPLECSQTYIQGNWVCPTSQMQKRSKAVYLGVTFVVPCTPLTWANRLNCIRKKNLACTNLY